MKLVWQRFKFLGFFILALFAIIPVLAFSQSWDTGFRIDPDQLIIPDLTAIGVGKVCVKNNSGVSYFIPTRTYPEWSAFAAAAIARLSVAIPAGCCGDGVCQNSTMATYPAMCFNIPSTPGCETPSLCWADCASKCDYQPAGIYTGAIYGANKTCGSTPACNNYTFPTGGATTYTIPTANNSRINYSGGCGFLERYHESQCGALMKPKYYLCDGGQCITGIAHSDYISIEMCVGTYDSLLNSCIYTGRVSKPLTAWGQYSYLDYPTFQNGSYQYNTNLAINNGTVASWGNCGTTVTCGDGFCSTGYGETCSSCASDCGACAVVCGDSSCNGAEDCTTCAIDCGNCNCSTFIDESTCPVGPCVWDPNSYNCVSGVCASASSEYDCQNAGCTWDYYGYYCY